MTYKRVIPRDLFNEADLLLCLGKLWIKLDERRDHDAVLAHEDGAAFVVWQDATDGSISCEGVGLTVGGDPVPLFRPLNARDKWPLWARLDEDDVRVFDLDGELSPEFWLAITEGAS